MSILLNTFILYQTINMATRTALLNGNVINRDTDFSKHIEAVSEPWVISWFAVSSSSVAVWQALVKCERTNGDIIYAVVYNNSAQEISWNGDVFIEIAQELIDNGELMNEDWSEIAEIKVGTMPSKNALKLATKSWNTITDARNMIKKSGELLALINQNIQDIWDLDDRVEALEEASAINHFEESWLVGELYTMSDDLFKQYTPTLANSTIDCNVSDTSNNAQIHIQRIGSGVASNQLKLKVKMVGSSTQNLKVEVRKWVQVTVTEWVEAYWYWNQVIASGSIAYSDISSTYAEKTVTLNANFWWTKGELLDIVVYMDTVNASNYYCVACDTTQYSEWFGYVSVNGSTRTRSKLMPYGVSDWFIQSMLVKASSSTYTIALSTPVQVYTVPETWQNSSSWTNKYLTRQLTDWWNYYWRCTSYTSQSVPQLSLTYWVEWKSSTSWSSPWWDRTDDFNFSWEKWDTFFINLGKYSSTGWSIKWPIYQTAYVLPKRWLNWAPKEETQIWNLWFILIYGEISDGNYKFDVLSWEISTTYSSGGIALWNAVWFITIYNPTDKWYYKIPVYK